MKSMWMVCLLVGVMAVAVGCGDDGNTDNDPVDDANNDTGAPVGVRLFHGLSSVNGSLTAIFRDDAGNNIEISNIGFEQERTHEDIAPGVYTVLFSPDGGAPIVELTIDSFNVEAGGAKTIFLSESPQGDLRPFVVPDEIEAPGENQTRLRFLHQARSGGIDVYDQADGQRLAQRIEHSQFTTYTEVVGAPYTFDIFAEDTVMDPLGNTGELALLPSNVYTIVIVGQADPNEDGDTSDSTVSAILLNDATF